MDITSLKNLGKKRLIIILLVVLAVVIVIYAFIPTTPRRADNQNEAVITTDSNPDQFATVNSDTGAVSALYSEDAGNTVVEQTTSGGVYPFERMVSHTPDFRVYGNGLTLFLEQSELSNAYQLFQGSLSKPQIERLLGFAIEKGFFDLENNYPDEDSEARTITVKFNALDRTHEVSTNNLDTAPRSLLDVINKIQETIQSITGREYYLPRQVKLFVRPLSEIETKNLTAADKNGTPNWIFEGGQSLAVLAEASLSGAVATTLDDNSQISYLLKAADYDLGRSVRLKQDDVFYSVVWDPVLP